MGEVSGLAAKKLWLGYITVPSEPQWLGVAGAGSSPVRGSGADGDGLAPGEPGRGAGFTGLRCALVACPGRRRAPRSTWGLSLTAVSRELNFQYLSSCHKAPKGYHS